MLYVHVPHNIHVHVRVSACYHNYTLLSAEMPGLMLLRRKTCASTGDKPLKGARIVGCTHITAQVYINPLHTTSIHVYMEIHVHIRVIP